jgi:hypothetical protein
VYSTQDYSPISQSSLPECYYSTIPLHCPLRYYLYTRPFIGAQYSMSTVLQVVPPLYRQLWATEVAISRNIQRDRMAWRRIGRILAVESANTTTIASINKALVQVVLLYLRFYWQQWYKSYKLFTLNMHILSQEKTFDKTQMVCGCTHQVHKF